MRKTLVLLVAAVLGMAPGAAAQQADVMAVLHRFVDGFNNGDIKSALSACADETSIIDEFPPYEWHGAGACGIWANAYDADAKKNGITDGVVTLGTPTHVDVSGDVAYVVAPVAYTFKQKGKPMKEASSRITVSLKKTATGWRMTGWAWAKN